MKRSDEWRPTRSQLQAAHDVCQLCTCGHVLGAHSDSPPHPCLQCFESESESGDCGRFAGTGVGVCECHEPPGLRWDVGTDRHVWDGAP